MRIRTRLLLLLVALAAVPTLATGLLAWRGAERALAGGDSAVRSGPLPLNPGP